MTRPKEPIRLAIDKLLATGPKSRVEIYRAVCQLVPAGVAFRLSITNRGYDQSSRTQAEQERDIEEGRRRFVSRTLFNGRRTGAYGHDGEIWYLVKREEQEI